ncbi:Serine/threonine protein kinase PrkC, regulator of stationary phase [Enhygromyxa salina]|uniref:mitogen-activated protein kinase kinase n=1 Tax=Enhygromyxa salina TaxID=215803 RepID=A0A0C2CYM2_9BACT|nr:Serine/threonine protein kinase PrkC, regulator of stationary phase [Enhygromyxa salina]
MATVYRARDRDTGHHYALKLLHDRNARDPRAARRFTREAELARTLRDPHIIGVHGAIEFQGRQALLMELVDGPTLAQVLAVDAPLSEHRLLTLARGIARGLSVAHAGGVIHRDLKPANILIAQLGKADETAKIADFGMARATSFAGVDSEALTVLGTPDYMAPETLDPLAVDPRTDLYALGCIMSEMATGRPPFAAPTPFAVLDAHRKRPAPKLPETFSGGLRELVSTLLAKQPSDRPHAASAVVEAIDQLLAAPDTGEVTALAVASKQQLARARPRDLLAATAAGRCARCGAPVIHGVRVCLDCGLLRVTVEPGKWTVFVVGPGAVGDKLDSVRRDALLTWLRANPDAGLEIGTFAEQIPRLPFPLVVRVSEPSARALTQSLAQLGLHAEANKGGRFSHGKMTEKMARIGARRSKVALPLLIIGLPLMIVLLVLALPLVPLYVGAVAWWTSKPALQISPTTRMPLPPLVDARLREVERVAPSVSARHRPGLRAVIQRVMALLRATPEAEHAQVDAEMTHALAVATVGTQRMTELDAMVSHPDFDASESEHRRDLQERDMWAARMLELTATLDALVARQAAARQVVSGAERESHAELDALRDRVEALEEVHRL